MDPNANLAELRGLQAAVHAIVDQADPETGEYTIEQSIALQEHAQRMAELFEALDNWITNGGFLPQPWQMIGRTRL